MEPDTFKAPEAGRVVRTVQGDFAFLPAPLPPDLTYTPELVRNLSEADASLSELAGLGRVLPNPHLLIAPYMRREAVLSSRIEGTQTSLAELMADEAGQRAIAPDDVQEVRNYVAALEYGIERLNTLPLSLRLVRELHQQLMGGGRGDSATPGEFRQSQNWIGPTGSTPNTASYVPPPPQEMLNALDRWEKFLHRHDEMPDLVQCALMHEHFEAVHPFLDGNGRVGRLLITLFLIERDRLPQPLLYLSEYIERERQTYYDALMRVRTHGDWHGWLQYFLRGVSWSARRAASQARQLMDLREDMRATVGSAAKPLTLIDALFENPYLNTPRTKQLLGVTDPTARKALSELEDTGLIEESTGRNRGRQYLAPAVLAAIEHPAER